MRRRIAASLLLVIMWASDVQADGPPNVDDMCPPPPEPISEGSREWQRDRICRSYLDMPTELDLDDDQWQPIIDALTDRHIEQNRRDTINLPEETIREQAASRTKMLSRVRVALGDDRMEDFYAYLNSGRERSQLGVIERALPVDAPLSPDQKTRLVALLTQRNSRFEQDESTALWQPKDLIKFAQEEQGAINDVNQIARWQLGLLNSVARDAELERHAAGFLSPTQMATLTRVNSNSQKELGRYIRRAWMALDHDKLAELQQRIAALPREQPPIPIDGKIEVEYSVSVDDGGAIVGKQSVANSVPITLKHNDLLIQIKATIYRRPTFDIGLFRRPWQVDVSYFMNVRGGLRKLQVPTSSGRGTTTYAMVEGVRAGHVVKSTIQVSD